jgi:hypothetical protein
MALTPNQKAGFVVATAGASLARRMVRWCGGRDIEMGLKTRGYRGWFDAGINVLVDDRTREDTSKVNIIVIRLLVDLKRYQIIRKNLTLIRGIN